jgi:hypothetical protein
VPIQRHRHQPRSWGSLGLWRTVQFGFLATFDKPQGFNKSLIDVVIRVQALVVVIVKEALQLIIGAGLDVPIAACTIARIVKVILARAARARAARTPALSPVARSRRAAATRSLLGPALARMPRGRAALATAGTRQWFLDLINQ